MRKKERKNTALDGLIKDLLVFIELSFQEEEISLREWLDETVNNLEVRCWEKKQCNEVRCPAYQNDSGRCWLIAGTMCGGEIQGKFVKKYGSCTKCYVFQVVIGEDPVHRLRELIIILIHSLHLKQDKLKESLSQIKRLSGLLPICASCKKIRDDKGYWNQLEEYVRNHSEAEFSHSVCPDCVKKLYPDIDLLKNDKV